MDKTISRQYFNDHALSWDETVRSNAPHQLSALAGRLPLAPDARVMDVGSGTGVFVPYIQRKLNGRGRVVCIDFAFEMLSIARRKNGNQHVSHLCAEIETAGFKSGVFDAAVCYSTFPHFHDKPLALFNIHALLRSGGRVFICHTASREFINNIHRNIADFTDHLIPGQDEMRVLLAAAGFRDIVIEEDEDAYLAVGIK